MHLHGEYLTLPEAAARLERSLSWTHALAQSGRLDAIRLGPRCWLIPAAAISAYLAQPHPRGNPAWKKLVPKRPARTKKDQGPVSVTKRNDSST